RPYGVGDFGEAGMTASFDWDSRKDPVDPRGGARIGLGGNALPPVWSVRRTFGEIHGAAAADVSPPLPLEPTLAVRVGGQRVFGEHPYQDSAFIGGAGQDFTVRGLVGQRYAGDASMFGNAEPRLRLVEA